MSDERPAARRAVFLGVAALLSLAVLGLALLLGAWAFAYRRDSLHAGRLERMLKEHPTEAQLTSGLAVEDIRLAASDASDATLARLLGPAAARAGDVRAKRDRFPAARLYETPHYVYVVFFGPDGKAADAVLLKR